MPGRVSCLALAVVLACCALPLRGQESPVTYAEVAPIFNQRCVMCHNSAAAMMELSLDSYAGVLKGSSNGPVVAAGDAAGSELVRRITGASQPRMPLTGPPFLSEDEIALVEQWVDGGLLEAVAGGEPVPQVVEAPAAEPELPAPGEAVTYAHVAPIFARRCIKCHAESGLMGGPPEGYLLTSYQAALSAGDRVRIVPGNPDASMVVRRVRGQSSPRMPFDGPPFLSAEEIRVIEDWVAQGAPDAQGQPAAVPAGAKIRIEGLLEPGWRVDGLRLVVTGSTRIDKSPRPGDYVEVRGRLDRNGNVLAERIRPR